MSKWRIPFSRWTLGQLVTPGPATTQFYVLIVIKWMGTQLLSASWNIVLMRVGWVVIHLWTHLGQLHQNLKLLLTSWKCSPAGQRRLLGLMSAAFHIAICVFGGGGRGEKDQLFSEIHFPVTRVETLYSTVIIQITLPKNGLSTCAYVPCKER